MIYKSLNGLATYPQYMNDLATFVGRVRWAHNSDNQTLLGI